MSSLSCNQSICICGICVAIYDCMGGAPPGGICARCIPIICGGPWKGRPLPWQFRHCITTSSRTQSSTAVWLCAWSQDCWFSAEPVALLQAEVPHFVQRLQRPLSLRCFSWRWSCEGRKRRSQFGTLSWGCTAAYRWSDPGSGTWISWLLTNAGWRCAYVSRVVSRLCWRRRIG